MSGPRSANPVPIPRKLWVTTIVLAAVAAGYLPILILIARDQSLPDVLEVVAQAVGVALFCCLTALWPIYGWYLRRRAIWLPEELTEGALRKVARETPRAPISPHPLGSKYRRHSPRRR